MADAVFFFWGKGSKGFLIAIGSEYRVVAKTAIPFRGFQDFTLHNPFEKVFPAVEDEAYNSSEACSPVLHSLHHLQKLADVVGSDGFFTGKPGRIYPGCPVKSLHLQPGVVRKTIHPCHPVYKPRFGRGISLKGILFFGDIPGKTVVAQAHQDKSFTRRVLRENMLYLLKFVEVHGGHQKVSSFHIVKLQVTKLQIRRLNYSFSYLYRQNKCNHMSWSGAVFRENVVIAVGSVRSHLLRSILTMLIIAFGITALVGILTAIDSIRYSLTNEFSRMGANTFSIRNRQMFVEGDMDSRPSPPITYKEASAFKEKFSEKGLVSFFAWGGMPTTVKYGSVKTHPNISVMGCDENYLITSGYSLSNGRNFSLLETEAGSNVAIIGSVLAERLFRSVVDPLGKMISVGSVKYRVIGVLESKGSSMGFSNDNNLFVPVNNIRRYQPNINRSYEIQVKAADATAMQGTLSEARALFRNIRRLDPREGENFAVETSDNLVRMLIDNISTITLAATFIGLITLLGAAIGLMNIMLVSVTERTREIGIRKAMGATASIIRNQFLIEAVVIGVFGGLIGILTGMLVGNITTLLTGGMFIVPWGWMIMGVSLCILVGLLSGLYPASRAARLDPIESLRYE